MQIVRAKNEGKKIRVVGGQHSINEAIFDKDTDLLLYLAGDFRKMEHLGSKVPFILQLTLNLTREIELSRIRVFQIYLFS